MKIRLQLIRSNQYWKEQNLISKWKIKYNNDFKNKNHNEKELALNTCQMILDLINTINNLEDIKAIKKMLELATQYSSLLKAQIENINDIEININEIQKLLNELAKEMEINFMYDPTKDVVENINILLEKVKEYKKIDINTIIKIKEFEFNKKPTETDILNKINELNNLSLTLNNISINLKSETEELNIYTIIGIDDKYKGTLDFNANILIEILYLGTSKGLLDEKGNTILNYQQTGKIIDLIKDNNNLYVITNQNGILDINGNTILTYQQTGDIKCSKIFNNALYIGTSNKGLLKYENNILETLFDMSFIGNVNTLYVNENNLYIASSKGVYDINKNLILKQEYCIFIEKYNDKLYFAMSGIFGIYDSNNNKVNLDSQIKNISSFKNYNNNLYIGTEYSGLWDINNNLIGDLNKYGRNIKDMLNFKNKLYIGSDKGVVDIDANILIDANITGSVIKIVPFIKK